MEIFSKEDIEMVDKMLKNGKSIADVAREFPDHDYETIKKNIYENKRLYDSSIQGMRAAQSRALKRAQEECNSEKGKKDLDHASKLATDLYEILKENLQKLEELRGILNR